MFYRTILAALAALAVSSAAAQHPAPAPAPALNAATADPAADEPVDTSRTREEVVVSGARPLPVPGGEDVVTIEERERHQAESKCIVQAQGAADPTRPELESPEDLCRAR